MYRPLVILLLFCACTSQAPQPTTTTAPEPPAGTHTSDTITINGKAALFYHPDSMQIATAKQSDSDAFYVGADDALFYTSKAQEFLDSVGIKTINSSHEKVLRFLRSDGSTYYISKDTLGPLPGIYLFDGVRDPYPPDITVIGDEYQAYFK